MRQAGHGQQLPLIPDETVMTSLPHTQASPDRLPSRNTPQPGAHSRDVSTARGRPVDPTALGVHSLQQHSQIRSQSAASSKSPEPGASRSGSAADGDVVEKRSQNSYGHHRQASVVHGNIQHTRNPSLALPTSSSPLHPETMQPAVYTVISTSDSKLNLKRENSPLSNVQDAGPVDSGSDQSLHRKGTQSSRPRREHGHHSKSSSQEARTVEEFALHHLFNSVCDSGPLWARRNLLISSCSLLARQTKRSTSAS